VDRELIDFFKTVKSAKKEKEEETKSLIGDSLENFFTTVKVAKKETKDEFREIIGNSFLEDFVKPLAKDYKQIKEQVVEIQTEIQEELEREEEEVQEEPKEDLIEKSLGLLAEPSNTKVQQDPITPLDQKFATLDDLQKHYKLFLNRIQQQLSTLGGGGETRLRYLDDVVGIATNSGAYNNKFLQWNSTTNKAEFVDPNDVGGTTIVNISGTTNYYQASNADDYIGVSADVPVTIVLPQIPSYGKKLIVKDEGNKIATYNITVQAGAGTSVENDSSVIMTINHQSFTYFYNGSNWFLI
jgi:hypothetical protein